MVLALAVIGAALFALPPAASAQSWHLDSTSSFSVSGSGGALTSSGGNVTCTGTTGSGAFSTTTEATVSLRFSGCHEPLFSLSCTSPGQSSGVIVANAKLTGIMIAANKPGVLLTPDTSTEITPGLKEISNFSCLGTSIKVFGKGVIGTISAPECGKAATTATLTLASSATGVQADQTWTGGTYDLMQTATFEAAHVTSSLDGTVTAHFSTTRTMTCT